MSAPVALDLFACGGGSSTGLTRAGFHVVGVDVKRQKSYGFEFIEADLSTTEAVLAVIARVKPTLISSSPPCQQFSSATPMKNRKDHPNLIPSTRAAIVASGVPGWIENVHGAPLHNSLRLCGTMFHATWRLKRHRYFETIGWYALEPEHRWCVYGPAADVEWTDALGVRATTKGSGGERRVAVAVAGHGPPDAAQSAGYKVRRDVESVHEGSSARAARVKRDTVGVFGFVVAPGAEREAQRRSVVSVNGDNGSRGRGPRRKVCTLAGDGGCPPGFGGNKEKRQAWRRRRDGTHELVEPDPSRRETVMLSVHQGEGPGQYVGQNRPGKECIRWREALGWIDGPKDRYCLSQAVPPCYAEWLGRAFLGGRG